MAGVKITDTTFRDSHQSLLATRMRMRDMVPIIEQMDDAGFFSLEVWGGATFDSCIRYLNEDPWERIRIFKKHMKKTPTQMLLRGQNLVGYKHYSDDIVEKFVEKSVKNGVDIFRIFDALNDIRNMEVSINVAKREGAHVQGTVCYTISPVHTIESFVDMAKKLEEMECDSFCIKDMAGLISPKNAYDLVKALKEEISIPINMHSHCTSGMAPIAYYAACQAGVDIIDTAMSPFSWGTSQPPTETMVEALRGTPYDTGINLESLKESTAFFKDVKKKYAGIIDPISEGIDTGVLLYQIPGGMLSNLVSQLKEQNALDRFDEVLKEMPLVKEDLGHPPLVTPSSQIVGIQAVMNVLLGERYKNVSKEVKDYVKGLYGKPPGPIKKEIIAKIIGSDEPITVRPADLIEPQYELMKEEAKKLGIVKEEDVLTYALFPAIAPKFLKGELKEEKLAPPAGDVKTAPDSGIPTEFQVEVDGEEFQVKVKPTGGFVEIGEAGAAKEAAPKNVEGGVPAPMQGMVLKIKVKVDQAVKKGDVIAVLEAMKMQNDIHAKSDGVVKEIFTAEGATVNKGAVLMVIK
ncbi:sodium-extruding oxaloacetate decarboxylase subunit alpha [archaeon]|nr:sodium-extruding oxaloacetate decarboxylase subunit alpha [archaeon]